MPHRSKFRFIGARTEKGDRDRQHCKRQTVTFSHHTRITLKDFSLFWTTKTALTNRHTSKQKCMNTASHNKARLLHLVDRGRLSARYYVRGGTATSSCPMVVLRRLDALWRNQRRGDGGSALPAGKAQFTELAGRAVCGKLQVMCFTIPASGRSRRLRYSHQQSANPDTNFKAYTGKEINDRIRHLQVRYDDQGQ